MVVAYGIMAVIALLLLVGYCVLLRQREFWLLLLYVSVAVVNLGYFLLSLSKTLPFALFANKLAYLGSILLLICMLMTVLRLCGFSYRRRLPALLLALALVMLLIVGSVPLYYKEISLVFVGSAARLHKVYGVLHPTYLVYTLAYFAAMIVSILYSLKKNLKASRKHAALMVGVVLGNLAIWFVEKFIPVDFEFLSVSYLFSELMLLAIYWMMQDLTQLQDGGAGERDAVLSALLPAGVELHPREREILLAVLENKPRREIAADLHLSENTVKTYTRTLYAKLGVGNRAELHQLLSQKRGN